MAHRPVGIVIPSPGACRIARSTHRQFQVVINGTNVLDKRSVPFSPISSKLFIRYFFKLYHWIITGPLEINK